MPQTASPRESTVMVVSASFLGPASRGRHVLPASTVGGQPEDFLRAALLFASGFRGSLSDAHDGRSRMVRCEAVRGEVSDRRRDAWDGAASQVEGPVTLA